MVFFLKKFPFFSSSYKTFSAESEASGANVLSYDDFIGNVADNIHMETYKSHELIFHHGDNGFKMYFVCQGIFQIFNKKRCVYYIRLPQ